MTIKTKGTILVIDDEDIVRFLLGDMLKSLGYSVVDFADPIKAIDFYEKNYQEIDLVFLDMTMPKLNGRETFFLLKKINREIKSIVLSGFSLNEDIEKILKEGCLRYLKKPVNMKDLEKVINSILKKGFEDVVLQPQIKNITKTLDIPEVDIEDALNNLGGNIDLFVKMLGKFVENYNDAGEKMKKMQSDEKYQELFVFSHSVKSVAASIGLSKLRAVSESIEKSCSKNEFIDLAEKIDEFSNESVIIVEKIKDFIRSYSVEQIAESDSPDIVETVTAIEFLNELSESALKNRPVQTLEIFNKRIRKISCYDFGFEDKEEIYKKIKRYDFESLVSYIQKIKDRLSNGRK